MSLSLLKMCSMGSSQIGLVGDIGITLLNSDGTVYTARTTSGIVELGGGCYQKLIDFPDDTLLSILWDTGGSDPFYAIEEYNVKVTLGNETVFLSSATETQIDNIETDTNEIQGKLPTNYIMGSSVVTDKDDEIDAIKVKTDNLPSDPASETNVDTIPTNPLLTNDARLSNLDATISSRSSHGDPTSVIETAISTSEENIRGAASITTTLETLSTQLDGVQTDLDNPDQYKATGFATENPPSQNLNDYKADVSNLDVTVSSRSSHSATDVWSVATRTLTSFGTLVTDIWAYATRTLTSLGSLASDVWAYATRGLTEETDIGAVKGVAVTNVDDFKADVSNLDVAVSTRSSHSDPTSAIETAISTSEENIRGSDHDTLKTLSGQADTIINKTNTLPSGIPKGVVLSNFTFLMVDSIDHVTPKTGLTVEAYISKDGGAFGSCTNSVNEIGNGIYKINLTAPEMTATVITLRFVATMADTRHITLVTST